MDPDVLHMLADLQEPGGPDLLREIIEAFLVDAPDRLRALHEAIASGDREGAVRAAHTLKGSAGAIGATALQRLAGIAEVAARELDSGIATGAAQSLEREYDVVRRHLAAVLASRPE